MIRGRRFANLLFCIFIAFATVFTIFYSTSPKVNTQSFLDFYYIDIKQVLEESRRQGDYIDEDDFLDSETVIETEYIPRSGQDITDVLFLFGFLKDDIAKIEQELLSTKDGGRLLSGQAVKLFYRVNKEFSYSNVENNQDDYGPVFRSTIENKILDKLTFRTKSLRDIKIERRENGDGFFLEDEEIKLEKRKSFKTGLIESSLYADVAKVGASQAAITNIIKIMSYDVDFQRDLQKGDSFAFLSEDLFDKNGHFVKTGTILYASLDLKNDKKVHEYFLFDDGRYYDRNGLAAVKSFLKTPVDGARLTSGFGIRKHPILGYSKLHSGLDFGAHEGTPVYSSADGIVQFVGWNGNENKGYGRLVIIKHNATYSTAYAHLSKFSKSIKNGSKVSQGQILGYVGSSGYATGPHLHYEVIKNGHKINPKSITTFGSQKLDKKSIARFKQIVWDVDNNLKN